MNKRQLRGSLCLLLCAFLWGSTFVAQQSGADHLPPFTFLASRSFVGSAALFGFSRVVGAKRKAPSNSGKHFWIAGILCGFALAIASACQQWGITLGTTPGKSGFLTAMYLVFVPLLSLLLYRKSPGFYALCGCTFAAIGLYFLCGVGVAKAFAFGDLLSLACGLCFAVHILIIDRFAQGLDGIRLSCLQFFVCGMLSLAAALIWESPSLAGLQSAIGSILYAGIFSSGIAYTLQIYGQKHCPATLATVLMSLESVFALLSEAAAAVFTNTAFSFQKSELFGCTLMFVGVLLAQITKRSQSK